MKKNKNKSFNIRITEDLLNEYKKHCEDHGYDLSKRVRLFMNADLSGKLKIKKDE